ncbi:sensor histidine kinase [Streptomyces albus subsp. chlorinus]|uniref:sensor histidine kinase n=1 Tax=Streptomyces albus TaxID=1888 RepID=UPI0031F63304
MTTGRPGERGVWRTLGLRWVHLLQGGAQLMPFYLLTVVLLGIVRPEAAQGFGSQPRVQFLTFALSLPLVAVGGLLPLVRALESASARTLCGVPAHEPTAGPAGSWAARRRSAAWFTLHVSLGGLVSGASLAVPPMAVVLLVCPLVPGLRAQRWVWPWEHAGSALWAAPPAGAALLALLLAAVYGAGALLTRCAPVLLGPTPADRLAAAERRAADLAVRNRLARELHDSVGHALSAVTLQAGAARRVLQADPGFVREALAAIEETSRGAVAELDAVLGILREGGTAKHAEAVGPTLATGLESLLARTRATGTEVQVRIDEALGPPAALDERVSAEAFRVVQEGLSNTLRHAPGAAVRVLLEHRREETGGRGGRRGREGDGGRAGDGDREASRGGERTLRVTIENATDGTRPASRRSGGRGLAWMAERAALLGGTVAAGEEDGVWRLTVRLPLTASRTKAAR